jgi:multidrug efflux pump subunit AcrA (membrane-fusion protein)
MDIQTTRKPKSKTRRYLLVLVLAVPAVLAARYLWTLGRAEFSIERETLVFDEVKRGPFTVSVRGTGVLVPDNIQWLSANVDATVVRRAVKAGDVVARGDLIVELSNPGLVQRLAESRWELQAQRAESKAAKVARELELLEQKAGVANVKMRYESSQLRKQAQAKLLASNAVSRLDYERTVLETDQFKQRWMIRREQFEKMEENVAAQDNARTARLKKISKTVERNRQRVDDLHVKATMDSIVLDLPLEAGQRVAMGDNIAKLAQQDSLIAELRVPENQIRDVAVGQRVIVDTRNNTVEGAVSRVDPAVVNGNVRVDVVFAGGLPDDARPDLSVDGEIRVAEIEDTLHVSRPLFAQSQSRSAFYRLSDDGRVAERVEVETGYGSTNRIEIAEGLKAGDTIITSDPERFEQYRKFRID